MPLPTPRLRQAGEILRRERFQTVPYRCTPQQACPVLDTGQDKGNAAPAHRSTSVRRREARDRCLPAGRQGRFSVPRSAGLSIPNSWIRDPIKYISDKISDQREHGCYGKDGHHHGIISREDGLIRQSSYSGPGKD
jgi:hypothetical protein